MAEITYKGKELLLDVRVAVSTRRRTPSGKKAMLNLEGEGLRAAAGFTPAGDVETEQLRTVIKQERLAMGLCCQWFVQTSRRAVHS